ncbi:MAG: ABC transporter ATP-binding protein, partial [Bacteroidales bacterium]|nr:ABC transporter ATP-binding protein [Bacteroidales bacterium]
IKLDNLWKKYYRQNVFHRSLREDITNLIRPGKNNSKLSANEFWVLKGINLEVKSGESIGCYGPNGAGKSTILKLIANVTFPTKGSVTINGRVAPLIEIGAGFHKDLTGRENIYMNGAILGMKISEIKAKIDSIIAFSEIEEFIDMSVKKYSSGMYLRLGFSIAIHSEAEILLIDEILAVGDEAFKDKCIQKVMELKQSGKTMVIVTHNRKLMEKVADRVVFLKKGVIL